MLQKTMRQNALRNVTFLVTALLVTLSACSKREETNANNANTLPASSSASADANKVYDQIPDSPRLKK